MLFKITQEDINEGKKYQKEGKPGRRHCPTALCLSKLFKNVGVGFFDICLGENTVVLIKVPKKLNKFINDFDSKRKVKPFEFELEI